MSTDVDSVLSSAMALSQDERAHVAAELFASLEGPDPDYSPERAQAWAREVERRIEQFASGESVGVEPSVARQQVKAALAVE
ncbi:MAG TPA: addiction module protein [Ilumatobacter sp.]|nr:addiction module protein [Ilumatobacter sp.]